VWLLRHEALMLETNMANDKTYSTYLFWFICALQDPNHLNSRLLTLFLQTLHILLSVGMPV